MLPLICTFIFEAVNGEKKAYLKMILSYAFMFCTQFYFAYMVGIFSFCFWIFMVILKEKQNVRVVLKQIVYYAGSVLLAVCMAMIVILPAFLFLTGNMAEDASKLVGWKTQIFDVYHSMFLFKRMPIDNYYPAIYCGWLTLLFVPLYFFNTEIKLKEKICSGIFLLFMMATMLISPLYIFMHAFDAPDGYNFRHAFLLVFLLCALACRQSAYLDKLKKSHLFVVIGIQFLGYFVTQWIVADGEEISAFTFIANMIAPLLWFGVWSYIQKKPDDKKTIALLATVVVLVELCFNGWFCAYEPTTKLQKEYECYKEGIVAAMEELHQDDGFYRAYYNADYITNSDAWFDYNGISDFCTAENYTVRSALRNLGLYTTPRRVEFYGITPPTEMLLNVKYFMQGPYPYAEYGGENIYYIENNPYYLEIGFMSDDKILDYNGRSLVSFENINELMSALCGEDVSCFVPLDETVLIECEQAEIQMNEEQIIIQYDSDAYEYGMVTYYIPKEAVDKTMYIQFVSDSSIADPSAPYLAGGMENVVTQMGLLSVSYIKQLYENEGNYELSVVMNETTADTWEYKDVAVYEYKEDEFKKVYDALCQSQLTIEEYADGYLKGNVTVQEDKNILFTSIPYDEGWSVWVDGVKTEPIAVVGDAFMALELEPGYHELEFAYSACGVNEGIIISGISVGAYIVLVALYTIRIRRKKNEAEANI